MAFTDAFTGTNGDSLGARSGWTVQGGNSGDFKVLSNGLEPDSAGTCSILCTDQGSADCYVQAKLVTLTGLPNAFIACRLVDHNNAIGWRLFGSGGTGSRMGKIVSGVVTDLVTHQGAANDVYKVVCSGTTAQLFKNGVQQGTDQTVASSTETSQGVLTTAAQTATSTWIDDFEAGANAGGGGSVIGPLVGAGHLIGGSPLIDGRLVP